MIIFLKGVLRTLDYFVDCMAENVENANILDISEEAFCQELSVLDPYVNESTNVITFNNVGIDVETLKGENYWDYKKVKLYNIYVDSPVWYREKINFNLQCMQIITVDRYHKELVDTYFPDCKLVQFCPMEVLS